MFDSDSLARALRVVAITDATLAHPRAVEDVVRGALRGGCRCIQLRAKETSSKDLLAQALVLRSLTDEYGALLIINDRFEVAIAARADGVHVGPEDLPVTAIRASVSETFLIGASCDDVLEAQRLVSEGADYLGCGAVYATQTKSNAGQPIGALGIRELAAAVPVPVVAIGGITPSRAAELSRTGARGVAVVGAIMGAEDAEAATRELLANFDPGLP